MANLWDVDKVSVLFMLRRGIKVLAGEYSLPTFIEEGRLVLESLGEIITGHKHFHDETHIFPVGYRVTQHTVELGGRVDSDVIVVGNTDVQKPSGWHRVKIFVRDHALWHPAPIS
eukprot:755145-Hanusia_phi.AAC.2